MYVHVYIRGRMRCVERMRPLRFADAQVIIKKGTVGTALYIVGEGAVRVIVVSAADGEIVQELPQGAFFGEIAFLATCVQVFKVAAAEHKDHQLQSVTDQLRTCDVLAKGPCLVWELHVRDFVEVIGSDMANNWEVLQMLTKSSQARVQRLMLMRSVETPEEEKGEKEVAPIIPIIPLPPLPPQPESDVKVNTIQILIPGKLGCVLFSTEAATKQAILEKRDIYFFSSDFHEDYVPFFEDFGPVNLGVIYQFCQLIHTKVSDPRLGSRTCTYYAESDGPRRTNAVFLLGAYLVIVHRWQPEQAIQVFQGLGPGLLQGYKHALNAPSDFRLSVLDCLRGLQKAVQSKWFDLETFDLDRYHLLENPGQFDLHQICPKFVAFRGPDSSACDPRFHAPSNYCELFKGLGVTAVVCGSWRFSWRVSQRFS